MRRELPMILAFAAGLLLILDFFVPAIRPISEMAQNWFLGVIAFAILIGQFSLIRTNYFKIRLKQPDWGYSIVLLIGLGVMGFLGFFGHLIGPAIEFFQSGSSSIIQDPVHEDGEYLLGKFFRGDLHFQESIRIRKCVYCIDK